MSKQLASVSAHALVVLHAILNVLIAVVAAKSLLTVLLVNEGVSATVANTLIGGAGASLIIVQALILVCSGKSLGDILALLGKMDPAVLAEPVVPKA